MPKKHLYCLLLGMPKNLARQGLPYEKEMMVLLLCSSRITFIGNGLIIQSRGNPSSTSKQLDLCNTMQNTEKTGSAHHMTSGLISLVK